MKDSYRDSTSSRNERRKEESNEYELNLRDIKVLHFADLTNGKSFNKIIEDSKTNKINLDKIWLEITLTPLMTSAW